MKLLKEKDFFLEYSRYELRQILIKDDKNEKKKQIHMGFVID